MQIDNKSNINNNYIGQKIDSASNKVESKNIFILKKTAKDSFEISGKTDNKIEELQKTYNNKGQIIGKEKPIEPNNKEIQKNEKIDLDKHDESIQNENTNSKPSNNEKNKEVNELTKDEEIQVQDLKKRDQEVRAHEAAHKSAGGSYAGAMSFEYQQGPDNKRYAIGGEVSIDTSSIAGDPSATIKKAQVIKRAALAPAKPSGQDRRVAASAMNMEQQARAELLEEKSDTKENESEHSDLSQKETKMEETEELDLKNQNDTESPK